MLKSWSWLSVKPTVLKRPENDVTERNTTDRNVATLETAPTRYVEGGGRFAYRQLGPSTGTPLVLLQHFSGNIDARVSQRPGLH
jgi:hypothetical protein